MTLNTLASRGLHLESRRATFSWSDVVWRRVSIGLEIRWFKGTADFLAPFLEVDLHLTIPPTKASVVRYGLRSDLLDNRVAHMAVAARMVDPSPWALRYPSD